jgi:hypothetical protein
MSLERIAAGIVGSVLTVSGAASASGAAPASLTTETLQIAIGALLLGYTLGAGAAARQTIAAAVRTLIARGDSGGGSGGKSGGAA